MIELVYKINSKVMEVIAMFMKELAVILIQGGLLLILALTGYFFFNDKQTKKKTKCNHIKKTSKMYNFIIEDSENIKKVL